MQCCIQIRTDEECPKYSTRNWLRSFFPSCAPMAKALLEARKCDPHHALWPSHCDNLEFPREADMPARISEAIVLRTYPLKEADLIVSFLTRDRGKLRGVAKRARRPKSGFGAGLERLAHGKVFYFQRETRELVNLDACELIHSHFGLHGDFTVSLALDFITEVSEQFLPAAEVNERFFRLLLTVLEHLRESAQNVWRAVTYFSLWVVRL